MEECGPCPVIASFTLAFALQLRKNHGITSVRVRKSSVRVQYIYWYDIFNCNWVDTRWQLFGIHIHTNNTGNVTKQTIHRTTQKVHRKTQQYSVHITVQYRFYTYWMGTGSCFLRRGINHSPPSRFEVKNKWNCNSCLPYAFMTWTGTNLYCNLLRKYLSVWKRYNTRVRSIGFSEK
jgi:hypothetical protein